MQIVKEEVKAFLFADAMSYNLKKKRNNFKDFI